MMMMVLKNAFLSPLCTAILRGGSKNAMQPFRGIPETIPFRDGINAAVCRLQLDPCSSSASTRLLCTARVDDGESFLQQPILGYHLDEFNDWVAELECGHYQHVRHNPPMTERPWVLTEEGRNKFVGYPLTCKKCAQGAPRDDGN